MNKKILVSVVIIVIFIVFLFVFIQGNKYKAQKDDLTNWKTYTNNKYGYEIKYPQGWSYREYPGTLTGAGFSPNTLKSTPETEVIDVDEMGRALDDCSMPFENFVKVSAIHNIQDFEKLNSIENIKTENGETGYETTWVHGDFSGERGISLPMTYFEDKNQPCNNAEGSVVVSLGDKNYLEIYEKMIKGFKFFH